MSHGLTRRAGGSPLALITPWHVRSAPSSPFAPGSAGTIQAADRNTIPVEGGAMYRVYVTSRLDQPPRNEQDDQWCCVAQSHTEPAARRCIHWVSTLTTRPWVRWRLCYYRLAPDRARLPYLVEEGEFPPPPPFRPPPSPRERRR